eukprot:TRINITY_DN34241_c0_g1_i1.p1 TRINITY_DN34241_c0_g1~~TRINITY_DN34241_c0_g1_i1.p1  ORF type:complete len:364 (-),score=57.12 TRINITY_DN34241_c0_g1_i1:45-1064(-)
MAGRSRTSLWLPGFVIFVAIILALRLRATLGFAPGCFPILFRQPSRSLKRAAIGSATELPTVEAMDRAATGTEELQAALDMSNSSQAAARQQLKSSIYKLAAALDRGQAYNPTSGEYYAERMKAAQMWITKLIDHAPPLPTALKEIDGEWELVYSTVKHGIFRSSPFFLAVQEAYGSRETAELFFKLHDLQTHAWGISKVGRVAQHIDSREGRLYSEFDSSLFSLTSIPLVGFWKLLPTFGGCFATTASVQLVGDQLAMEVQHTEMKRVPGLEPASDFVVGPKVPVNDIWQLLPWNGGRRPTCKVTLRYVDEDMRIVEDDFGEFFVYSRPADPQGVRPR